MPPLPVRVLLALFSVRVSSLSGAEELLQAYKGVGAVAGCSAIKEGSGDANRRAQEVADVNTGSTLERVVARTAEERIRICLASQDVVALKTLYGIVAPPPQMMSGPRCR
jgi:hypothetical protein